MQPQPGSIRAFFRPAAKPSGGKQGADRAAAPAPASERTGDCAHAAEAPAMQQFSRKRRRPSGSADAQAAPVAKDDAAAAAAVPAAAGGTPPAAAAAVPAAAGGTPPAAAAAVPAAAGGTPPAAAAPPAADAAAAAAKPRQLTQMYLDVGQRHFHSYRCPACGMLYARGTDADERLHAAFHASATQGPRYTGWAGEQVVQLDGSRGRVLLFSAATPARPRKPLLELAGFLEEQMGLPKGWLLQVPLTVLLYVSSARRVQAVVAAEAIKEAYCVQPCLPPSVVQGLLSCGSAAHTAASSSSAQPRSPAAAAMRAVTNASSLPSMTPSSGAAAPAAECNSGGAGDAAQADAADAAAEGGSSDAKQPQRHDAQQQQQQQQEPPQRPPLELDRSQRVRAVCGVRLMWVSVEARRRGLATRLLDCCRSQVMPGYVLPRHELAFSAPTEDGRAFAEEYAGTRRFLVYE